MIENRNLASEPKKTINLGYFIFFALIFIAYVYFYPKINVFFAEVALDYYPPSKVFTANGIGLIKIIPICVVVIIMFLLIFLYKMMIKWKDVKKISWFKFIKRGIIVIISIIFFGGLIFGGLKLYQNQQNQKLLQEAKSTFSITSIGNITKRDYDATAEELEKQLLRLNVKYSPTFQDYPIMVEVFPDVNTLKQHSLGRVPEWTGGYMIYENGHYVIHIASMSDNTSSDPAHELIHYIIYEKIDKKYQNLITRWINEGLAEYESTRGFSRLAERADIIGYFWVMKSTPMNFVELNTWAPNSNTESADRFYATSFDLINYICQKYGDKSFLNIFNNVNEGKSLDSAFINEFGKTPEQLYNEWKAFFFS